MSSYNNSTATTTTNTTTKNEYSDHVFFFDIDNTLYPQSSGIGDMMADRIRKYCVLRMGMTEEAAAKASKKYYLDYGLAIRGLLKHHSVSPVDYDEFVDGGLPLDSILAPNKPLREMILRIKTRRWVFTNAGIFHATRVLKLLGISDLFEGITYCNYSEIEFPCKPEIAAYEKAMREAGIADPRKCYLIDDSLNNVKVAKSLGWKSIYCLEQTGNNSIGRGSMAIAPASPSTTSNLQSSFSPTSTLPISISHPGPHNNSNGGGLNAPSANLSSSPVSSISQAVLSLEPDCIVERVEDLAHKLPHLFYSGPIIDGIILE